MTILLQSWIFPCNRCAREDIYESQKGKALQWGIMKKGEKHNTNSNNSISLCYLKLRNIQMSPITHEVVNEIGDISWLNFNRNESFWWSLCSFVWAPLNLMSAVLWESLPFFGAALKWKSSTESFASGQLFISPNDSRKSKYPTTKN